MATKTETVRISYKELENASQNKDERNKNLRKDASTEKKKQKRPSIGLYQPRHLRPKQDDRSRSSGDRDEDWDAEIYYDSSESVPTSKESSVEKEMGVKDKEMRSQKHGPIADNKGESVSKEMMKRRSKRPEIQRYVPKGRQQLAQQQQRDDVPEDLSPGEEHKTSPRKVDLEAAGASGVQITVRNDAPGLDKEQGPPDKGGSPSMLPENTQMKKNEETRPSNMSNGPSRGKSERGGGMSSRGLYSAGNRGRKTNAFGRRERYPSGSSNYSQHSEDSYGTWPRERGDKRRSGAFKQGASTENWEDDNLHISEESLQEQDNHSNRMVSSATELPKPQRANERRQKDPGKRNASVEGGPANGDKAPISTMVFERSSSASSARETPADTDINNPVGQLKTKPPIGQSKGQSKRYSMSTMRRQRTNSFSSEASNASDLSIDEETTTKILDWDKEVEREMAKQVQDETLKLQEYLNNEGNFPTWEADIESIQGKSQTQDHQEGRGRGKGYKPSTAKEPGQVDHPRNHRSSSREGGYREDSNGYYDKRSPRKNRRKGSLNGPRSRDSSVSSAHSVHSYHGDDDMYGGSYSFPRRGRHRRTSSNSSLKDFDVDLKITFGQNKPKRQVSVQNTPGEGAPPGGRVQGKSRGRGRGRARSAERNYREQHRPQGGQHREDNHYESKGRGRGHARGQGHSDHDQSLGPGGAGRHGHLPQGRKQQEMAYQHPTYERQGRNTHGQEGNQKFEDRSGREGHPRDRKHSGGSQHSQSQRDHKKEADNRGKPPQRTGGLIRLPVEPSGQADGRVSTSEGRIDYSRDASREDMTGKKMLFDPKNPNKPIIIQGSDKSSSEPALKFQETDPQGNRPVGVSRQNSQPVDLASPSQPPPMLRPGFPPAPYFYPRFMESGYGPPPLPHPGMPPGYYYPYPQGPYREMYGDEAYRQLQCQDMSDLDIQSSGMTRAQCRVRAEQLLQEALPLDNQLGSLISRRINSNNATLLAKLRCDLQQLYEQVILLDLHVANKHNVEQLLWKSVFYQVIEVFRKHSSEDDDGEGKTHLMKILTEGTEFYEKFLQKLQQTYGFQLDLFLDANSLPPSDINSNVKLALLSTQRTLICLGDIARYKELSNESGKVNYGKARSWYLKAQQIAPKNGRPYNQLALLALYTRRKLDAVYYYMRSLAASNPFLTARESLNSLFDEARKKAETAEKKRKQEKEQKDKIKKQKYHHGDRVEIWISADGTSTKDNGGGEAGENDFSRLDAVELNKRFVLSFLNVHGKLFTKIGRETFMECCSLMLLEFQELLRRGAIGPSRLLQLMAINMFAVDNTALRNPPTAPGGQSPSSLRSELQEHAVQLGLDMCGILVKRCAELLKDHLASPEYPSRLFCNELEELIPGVKVWTDWMYCKGDLWNPPPNLRDNSMGPSIDVWEAQADLCNILSLVDISHVKLYEEDKKEGCDPILLSEDIMMAGFVPLLSWQQKVTFVHSTVEKEVAKDCHRIAKLRDFGDYLCGIEPPMLAFNVETKAFYSVAPSGYAEEEKGGDLPTDESESDVVIESDTELVIVEEGEEEEEPSEELQQLRTKREELKKKKEQIQRQKESRQELLERGRHGCIELEIHPIFLVPDTNCFIDHLNELKKLILANKFTVTIPLVVINELDGLAKGGKSNPNDSPEHQDRVSQRAQETVKFLEEAFERKNKHLRAQTSKGTVMETIAFRSEEAADAGINDDLILLCCLHYCKDKASEFMPKGRDEPVRLYRDVVLLTDDRNLQLKAHTSNIPVKDVPAFMKWAKIT